MKKFLKSFFTTFLAVTCSIVFLVLVVALIAAIVTSGGPDIEDDSWLVVNLRGSLLEYNPPKGMMNAMGGEPETLQRFLDNMEKVVVDDRIEGVILKISSDLSTGIASLQEMRAAIGKVREGGKEVLAYTESLDTRAAFLAAACDRIYTPPSAYVSFLGFSMESTHVLGSLEKLGIKPNIHKIKDYKSAAEMVIRKDMSDTARENREWLLQEVWDNVVPVLAADRGMSEEQVVALMEKAVMEAEEALEAGLIDELIYWDELEDRLTGEDEDELETTSASAYAAVEPESLDLGGDTKIAVVHAQGTIAGRTSRVDPLLGVIMGYETVVADLERAAEDEDVAAIILRIDSGGGDAYGSDIMGHMVGALKTDKPLVISMGDVAASGGYHLAYRADKIVADPMSIVGSIGSISGKFNMSGLHDKLGFSFDQVTKGPMARFFDTGRDFTKDEWERFQENHWRGFNSWLADVAEHRGMSFEEAEKLAHGRVFSGRQAVENGLIDELGGLDRAIEIARELAEIEESEQTGVVHYPESKGMLESLMGGNESSTHAVNWLLYRYIHEDLADTWSTLQHGRFMIMEDRLAD